VRGIVEVYDTTKRPLVFEQRVGLGGAVRIAGDSGGPRRAGLRKGGASGRGRCQLACKEPLYVVVCLSAFLEEDVLVGKPPPVPGAVVISLVQILIRGRGHDV